MYGPVSHFPFIKVTTHRSSSSWHFEGGGGSPPRSGKRKAGGGYPARPQQQLDITRGGGTPVRKPNQSHWHNLAWTVGIRRSIVDRTSELLHSSGALMPARRERMPCAQSAWPAHGHAETSCRAASQLGQPLAQDLEKNEKTEKTEKTENIEKTFFFSVFSENTGKAGKTVFLLKTVFLFFPVFSEKTQK